MVWQGERHRHMCSARGIKTHYTPDEIRIANMTSRTSPNKKSGVGTMAVVPKLVLKVIKPNDTVLDFGAGKYPKYAIDLQNMGYNVTAYEFGDNINPQYHDKDALNRKYDVVYASNVLNVQSTPKMMNMTIDQIKNSTKYNGYVVLNYPSKPRKMDMTTKEFENMLKEHFEILYTDKNNNAYICKHQYGNMGFTAWNEYDKMQRQGEQYAKTGNPKVFRNDSRLEILKR